MLTAPTPPRRFRLRLTAAFVLVATVSAGLVAVATFLLAREFRRVTFRSHSVDETRVAAALAPDVLSPESFERFRSVFETASSGRLLIVQGATSYSSSPDLTVEDVPDDLAHLTTEPKVSDDDVDGHTLVTGVLDPDGARLYVFFSRQQLEEGLAELARVAAAAWLLTMVVAAAVGNLVARRTLRPVAETAAAAEAIAAGDLDARLPAAGRDEFGMLAASFNHMADEVQHLVQRLEEAAGRERRFTADVAHELRTPLTGLAASSAMLSERIDELPESLRRPAAILVQDVGRLTGLVLELLELSRLDAEVEPPRLEPLRLRSAIEAVIRSAASRRDADVRVDVDAAEAVLADPSRLRRILANVIDNAIVHGAAPITITTHRDGDDVLVDVLDHGAGVQPDRVATVFDRFAKSDRSQAHGGTGLGLPIARQHARSLGGDVTLRNVDGAGACFTVRLPAADGDGPGPDR